MAKKLTEDEVLAYTLLGEAGGEGADGMAAVMYVIKNRAESGNYGSDLAAIALQKSAKGTYQFSTWGENTPPDQKKFTQAQLNEALAVVRTVKAGAVPDPTGGAQNYYANKGANAIAQPYWFTEAATGGGQQIGNHIFAAKGAVDEKATANFKQQLSAAMQGTAYPASMSPTTSQKRTASRIDYLPASADALQLSGGVQPIGQTRSRGAAGEAARSLNSFDGGLVSRSVKTVPIDPLTGLPTTAAGADAAKADLRERITRAANGATTGANDAAARNDARAIADAVRINGRPAVTYGNTTETVHKDGTVTRQVKPGSVAMPDGARPSILPKLPVPGLRLPTASPTASPSASAPVTQNWTTKLVTKTVTVKNPNYKPGQVNPVAVNKLQDIHDRQDATVMQAQGLSLTTNTEPEFIEQQIVVEERVPVLPKPQALVPQVNPVPQPAPVVKQVLAQTAVQKLRAQGLSPSDAYAQANTNAKKRAQQASASANGGRVYGSSTSGRIYNADTNTWE